jgi:DNA-binding NtrC family response regulator
MAERLRHILIIEDDCDVRRFLARFVEISGGKAVAVANGPEALDAFRPTEFDMLLTDVDLKGGIDGIAVAKELLALQPGLRVAVMSGNPKNEARAQEAGFGTFLAKPLDFSALALALGLEYRR